MMKRALAALVFLLGLASAALAQGVGPQPLVCNATAVSGTLASGTTALVNGVAGQHIQLCGYTFEGLAAGTVQLVFGTGSTCTTSTVATVTVTTAAASFNAYSATYGWISGTLGQTLCAVVTGTNPVQVQVVYSQF